MAEKATFKYRVIEETYRDLRRMAAGEIWVTQEPIHDSRALMPVDQVTEEAYLERYAKIPTRIPVRDPEGRVIKYEEGVPRRGQHVNAILERRKVPKDDHDAYVEVYAQIAEEAREKAEAVAKSKAKTMRAGFEKSVADMRAAKDAADRAAAAAEETPKAKA